MAEQFRLQTPRFGELVFDDSKVLRLLGGLIGIPRTSRLLVVQPGGAGPLYWLQSADDPNVAIVVADIAQVVPDYRPTVAASDLAELHLSGLEQALVLGVCVLAADPKASTVNLRAPLIVNPVARLGRQLLLDDDRYSIRHALAVPQAV